MIPNRSPLPMPGNARVATAVPKSPPPQAVLQDAPETPPPTPDDLIGGDSVPTVDPNVAFTPPPRPRTSGRPGAAIAFSAQSVEGMIRNLETALNPKVTFSEDVGAMRVEAHKARADAMQRVLAALRTPT